MQKYRISLVFEEKDMDKALDKVVKEFKNTPFLKVLLNEYFTCTNITRDSDKIDKFLNPNPEWKKWARSEEGQNIYKSDNVPFWAWKAFQAGQKAGKRKR